jgi:quercetin dioxygenase-like cupin family protein
MDISLDGWDIREGATAEWVPWGGHGNAKAKILGSGDGYMVTLVEADAGYRGDAHVHGYAEFFYVVDGTVRNQGRQMRSGDGYAASSGSSHVDFEAETAATYIVIFKI